MDTGWVLISHGRVAWRKVSVARPETPSDSNNSDDVSKFVIIVNLYIVVYRYVITPIAGTTPGRVRYREAERGPEDHAPAWE